MAKRSFSRRKFLQNSALGVGSVTLSSCATVDRWIMGDPYDLREDVVILGAGLAGLTAAFELKKRQIPFRLFEASTRVGGRVQSLRFGEKDGVDIGGEFIAESHLEIKVLLKELGLNFATAKNPSIQYYLANKLVGRTELSRSLQGLQSALRKVMLDLYREQNLLITSLNANNFDKAAFYDSQSLEDLLQSLGRQVSPVALDYVRNFAVNRYGVETKNQSSLHLLNETSLSGVLPSLAALRIEGGAGRLTQTLADRVVGVIPELTVKTDRVLVGVQLKRDVYHLRFKTATGHEIYRTKKIICTLPVTKLREVAGFANLPFSDGILAGIQNARYASHTKGVMDLESSQTPLHLWGEMNSQNIWSQPGQNKKLIFQVGGEAGRTAGARIQEDLIKDLRKINREIKPKGEVQMVNWLHRKWSLGSKAVYAPGEYTKYKGVFSTPEIKGSFLFAGEHTSDRFAGTLQGAVESALRSASRV